MKRGKASNRLLDFYLGIPVLNLLASFRRRAPYPKQPERIGIFLNPALGDTLLGSASILDVRNIFPHAKLILFATSANAAAAKLLPEIDEITLIPITRPIKCIQILRRCRLDLMLDFTSWQRITAAYTLLSGARFTAGFERKKQYRHRGYDKTVAHLSDCHEIENQRRLTTWLGASTKCAPRLVIPAGPVPGEILAGGKLIVLHAWPSGALSSLREWPEERWVELAKRLMSPERIFLLTGSPADEPRCHAVFERFVAQGIPARVLIGHDGIAGVARVLQRAELLISVNTGIMHLGAILGVPTVALNGPTSAHRWGPVGTNVANVSTSDASGGFLDLGFEFRDRNHNVMVKISVDAVVRAVQELSSNHQKRA